MLNKVLDCRVCGWCIENLMWPAPHLCTTAQCKQNTYCFVLYFQKMPYWFFSTWVQDKHWTRTRDNVHTSKCSLQQSLNLWRAPCIMWHASCDWSMSRTVYSLSCASWDMHQLEICDHTGHIWIEMFILYNVKCILWLIDQPNRHWWFPQKQPQRFKMVGKVFKQTL